MKEYVTSCLEKHPDAEKRKLELDPFFRNLFLQSNPLPLKAYLADKGIIEETFRLPMCPMDALPRKEFLDFIHASGL